MISPLHGCRVYTTKSPRNKLKDRHLLKSRPRSIGKISITVISWHINVLYWNIYSKSVWLYYTAQAQRKLSWAGLSATLANYIVNTTFGTLLFWWLNFIWLGCKLLYFIDENVDANFCRTKYSTARHLERISDGRSGRFEIRLKAYRLMCRNSNGPLSLS